MATSVEAAYVVFEATERRHPASQWSGNAYFHVPRQSLGLYVLLHKVGWLHNTLIIHTCPPPAPFPATLTWKKKVVSFIGYFCSGTLFFCWTSLSFACFVFCSFVTFYVDLVYFLFCAEPHLISISCVLFIYFLLFFYFLYPARQNI